MEVNPRWRRREKEEVTPEAPMSPPVAHRRAASFGAPPDAGDGKRRRRVTSRWLSRVVKHGPPLQRTPEEAAAGDGPIQQ